MEHIKKLKEKIKEQNKKQEVVRNTLRYEYLKEVFHSKEFAESLEKWYREKDPDRTDSRDVSGLFLAIRDHLYRLSAEDVRYDLFEIKLMAMIGYSMITTIPIRSDRVTIEVELIPRFINLCKEIGIECKEVYRDTGFAPMATMSIYY